MTKEEKEQKRKEKEQKRKDREYEELVALNFFPVDKSPQCDHLVSGS